MRITETQFQHDYKVCRLKENVKIDAFCCGDEDLDDFILNESSFYTKALISVTYIVLDKRQDNKIVAYFSLANDKLSVNDFNSNSEFNRFRKRRFAHEKILRSYPAVKLCRLGINTESKGLGLGSILIKFICALYSGNARAGCRFVTVDAYKTAVPFYEKNGFDLLTKKESRSDTLPLYFDLASF